MSTGDQDSASWHIKNYAEKEALQLIANDDQQAFVWLMSKYSDLLYSHCLAYTRSVQKAEELVQDIFLKIWTARKKLTEVEKFENWLFVIARNSIYRSFRNKVLETVELSVEAADVNLVNVLTPDLTTEARTTYQLLLKGIEQLPEKRRQVFRMSRIEGMGHKEIAAALKIHEITVAQYIVKSLSFLRAYMETNGIKHN